VEIGPVEGLHPTVTRVTVSQNGQGNLEVTGKYSGGAEGYSFLIWRVHEPGTTEPRKLGKSVDRVMVPTPDMIGKVVDCIYVPVREDGLAGTPTVSTNQITVGTLPTVDSAEILVKGGALVTGALMRVRTTVSKGSKPTFQWHRGDGRVWETIKDATDIEYTASLLDQGFNLRCTVVATHRNGWQSVPLKVTTDNKVGHVKAALEIHCDEANVETGSILYTNVPREKARGAQLKWQREEAGKWVDQATAASYLVTANDLGMRLRANVKDGRTSTPTDPVRLKTEVLSCVRATIRATHFTLDAEGKLGGSWSIAGDTIGIAMKSKAGTAKLVKWNVVKCECVPGTTDEMLLWLDPSTKFPLVPSLRSDPRIEQIVGQTQARDYTVAVMRGYMGQAM
jgi:hypothetical protein